MTGIARKGDTDSRGYVITGGTVSGVTIDGQPVAVKGSTMNDGVPIVSGTVGGVTVNGVPVAVVGSVTAPHVREPNLPGTIVSGDSGITAS